MKKNIYRIISLVMCILLLAGSMCITAFAEESGQTLHYDRYTVLGDSNASGYGLDAYFENAGSTKAVKEGDLIAGTYPAIVSEAVGAGTVNACAHSGWRTTELLRMLDPEFTDYNNDDYSDFYNSDFFLRALEFVSWDSLSGKSEMIQNSVANSDLITLNIGTNDLFSFALTVVVNRFSYIVDDVEIEDLDDVFTAASLILQRANDIEFSGFVTEFIAAVEYGMEMYEKNMPLILDRISELNPEADVLVVGLSNPVDMSIGLSDDLSIDIFQLSDLTVYRTNLFTKELCAERGVMFADVTGTECFGVEALDTELLLALDSDVKYSAVKMVHPTEAGHQYMASNILEVLGANSVSPVLTGRYSTYIKRNTLNWSPVDGAVRYRVYRATEENGNYRYIGMSTSDIYYDYATIPGMTYYYKITAVMNDNGTVTTPYSNTVSLKAK